MPGTPESDRFFSGEWAHLRRKSLAHEQTSREAELGKRASFAAFARIRCHPEVG